MLQQLQGGREREGGRERGERGRERGREGGREGGKERGRREREREGEREEGEREGGREKGEGGREGKEGEVSKAAYRMLQQLWGVKVTMHYEKRKYPDVTICSNLEAFTTLHFGLVSECLWY